LAQGKDQEEYVPMYEEGDSYIAPGDTSALFDDLDQDDDFF
jgi:hypothetical protein